MSSFRGIFADESVGEPAPKNPVKREIRYQLYLVQTMVGMMSETFAAVIGDCIGWLDFSTDAHVWSDIT